MKPRWAVEYGPQFAESQKECVRRVGRHRLQLHLDAIELSLERDPVMYSESFGDSHVVIETEDHFEDGFVVTAYVRLCQRFVVEIMWIAIRSLDEDDEEDCAA